VALPAHLKRSAFLRNFAAWPRFSLGDKEEQMPTELHSTSTLIGTDRVHGTAVFDADGQKIGAIACLMIEKVSGRVSFAVMSSGGFLGIGDEHYPIPWPALKYNPDLGGYQIMIPVERIKEAPKCEPGREWDWDAASGKVSDYYGAVTD